jgi:hypothetical protein
MDQEEIVRRRGAQPGNKNATKAVVVRKELQDAMRRRDERHNLSEGATWHAILERYIEDCVKGDKDTRRDLFDRVMGKPKQSMELTGEDGEPMQIVWPLPRTQLDR